ncbi:glutamate-rich protein 3 [Antennarius striatus]|uniref:glutamate-rich protein 3 n=1 Tax=Antennarius striatus TaxID=241820 RepID=UPI0035AEBDAA
MSHLNPGLISAYNSLTDKHLAGYFSNIRIRRHLQRAGLITRSGRIVPDKEYRHKQIQRTHQRHVRECLAQAIFHQVLEMERVHQIEIKRRLEEFARRERVNKIKVECSKRYEEDFTRILSPHPPSGPRRLRKQNSGPEGENSESSESPGSSRPNTAPEKLQRPVRLKPIHSDSTTATLRHGSPYRPPEASNESGQLFPSSMEFRRRLARPEASHSISPYCLPVINNFVTPVPPATKRKESRTKVTSSIALRSRRFRPATSFSGAEFNEDPPITRSSVHQSRVSVNMMYLGKTVHLSRDLTDSRDEVKVFQQHCGGENLCVYKGMLHEGETFRFISRRHRGFPFSLTFFLNGLQVERVSSCCEFKHRKGSRLGGRHRHFGFSGVEGASPCYKCIIAMGLDKKPTPPPKRLKEDGGRDKSVFSPQDAPQVKTEETRQDPASHSECETSQSQVREVKEDTAEEEDNIRHDYEEDFEADNEDPAEDAQTKAKKSPSPSCDSQRQVNEKERDSETEDEKDEDIKSTSASSFSGSDREDSDETDKDSGENEKVEKPKADFKRDQTDEQNPVAASPTEAESAVAKDSAGDSTEIDMSDTSVPSENKNKQNDDTSEDKEVEKMVDKNKHEEEPERAKSVQEKLAEAILKESQRSSEPELSDTSTEEEEDLVNKGPQKDSKDVLPEKAMMCAEQQQNLLEETYNLKEHEDETKQELLQKSNGPEAASVKEDKEDEKAESVENTAVNNEAELPENRSSFSVHEEEKRDQTTEAEEDAADKSTDGTEKEEDKRERTEADADKHLSEPGEEAAGCDECESHVSEPDKKIDETVASNNPEVEAMTTNQTKEMTGEASEEPVALVCEEAPVTNTDQRQQGHSEEQEAAADTQVTTDNSSSSMEGSGDTIVEKSAEINEDKSQPESNKADIEEEEVSEAGAGKEQEISDVGEEQAGKSLNIDNKVENKSEDECKEEEKPTNPDELAEADDGEENKVDDNERKSDSNDEGKAPEQVEKTGCKEDKAANEERADEPEKTRKDEDNNSVQMENHTEGNEQNEADKNIQVENITDANTTDNEKDDEVVENQNETEAEPSVAAMNKYSGDSEEVVAGPAEEEIIETAEEPEKKMTEDNVKTPDENSTLDIEAANVATTVETVKAVEAEDVKREKGSDKSQNGEIDAENGEISSRTDNKSQVEGEAESEMENPVKTAGNTANVNESKEEIEVTVKSGAEDCEDDNVDQSCDTDVAKVEAKVGHNKKDGSGEYNCESKTSDTDIEEPKGCEETKQDENGNLSDHDPQNRDSALIKNSTDIESDITEAKVLSLGDEEQLIPITADLDGTAPKLEESTKPSRTDGDPLTGENTAAVDLSGVNGEDENAEALSKASEEGQSLLLKPQRQSSPNTQNMAANTEAMVSGSKGTPEDLGGEDNIDLVKNWVTMHQASKYFETFVEPLEDLKESDAQESNPSEAAKLSGSESKVKITKMDENTQKQIAIDANESRDKTIEEGSEFKSHHSEDKLSVKDTEPEAESEQNKCVKGQDVRLEEHKGSRGSLEEGKPKETSMLDNPEQSDVSRIEVESSLDTHHTVSSDRPEISSEIPTEEKATENDPDLNEKQNDEERKDVLPSSETEKSPGGLSESDRKEQRYTKEMEMTNSQGDGSHDDLRHNDAQLKSSVVSINSDGRKMRLIRNIQHTLSKDHLSTFSADETQFGHSSYPLLTAARAQSEH